jgi:hypothetical protein
MEVISKSQLDDLRRQYPAGCEVELILMDDAQAPPAGTHGKVIKVDDIGTVHVAWNGGSSLGAVWGIDELRRIEK